MSVALAQCYEQSISSANLTETEQANSFADELRKCSRLFLLLHLLHPLVSFLTHFCFRCLCSRVRALGSCFTTSQITSASSKGFAVWIRHQGDGSRNAGKKELMTSLFVTRDMIVCVVFRRCDYRCDCKTSCAHSCRQGNSFLSYSCHPNLLSVSLCSVATDCFAMFLMYKASSAPAKALLRQAYHMYQ